MTLPNYLQNRPRLVSDTECYRNYWCIGVFDPVQGRRVTLERTPTKELDRNRLAKIIRNYTLVGFNFHNYDVPMILMAMTGATNEQLKECSNSLIPDKENGQKYALFRSWQFIEHHGLSIPPFMDYIDLWDVSPGSPQKLSLKLTAGRMHSKTMRDLPYHHASELSPYQISVIRDEYMPNDLDVTHDLLVELDSQLQIRIMMSERYGMDLRSKSDAQIAEAVIKKLVEQRSGRRIYKPDVKPLSFKYETPDFIKFETPELQDQLRRIQATTFYVDATGKMLPPPFLTKKEQVYVNGTPYQMGIGGLHSIESCISYYSDDDVVYIDRDVKGYYPKQIIKSGRNPTAMGHHFQPIFTEIVVERDVAKDQIKIRKKAGDEVGAKLAKDKSENGKVMTNGTFGKTGQAGSVLFAPQMMLQTTLGGQLSIFMLIEQFEMYGFKVISANTDGLVTRVPRAKRDIFEALIYEWEWATGLETEETVYRSIHFRDVNSYVALAENEDDGSIEVKTKGQYAKCGPGQPAAMGLKKAPDAQIASDAVVAFLKDGTPVEKTVMSNTDVRNFVVVKRVDGGCEFDGEYMGKAMRWYYSREVRGQLRSMSTGDAVADSMGARPLMTLPDDNELPDDIDMAWYIREAYARLEDAGVKVVDPALRGKKGTFLARWEDQKTVHVVDAATGVAMCGKARKSIREIWNETKTVPEGRGMCSKCKKASDL